MATYIALLRGINVSGQKKILMKDLREMCASLGFENVSTYLQSGNVVFSSKKQKVEGLAEKLETGIKETFGFDVPTLVIDSDYLEEVIEKNPFPEETAEDAKMPYALFLDSAPAENASKALEKPDGETAKFIVRDDIVYIFYPDGAGRSKLTTNFFERKLKVSATMRNWKTVQALFEMAQA